MMYLSKLTECTTPIMNPDVNYGPSVIVMCQCRFIDYNKGTTLVGDVDNGGGYACVGIGGYMRTLCSFAVNLKLL